MYRGEESAGVRRVKSIHAYNGPDDLTVYALNRCDHLYNFTKLDYLVHQLSIRGPGMLNRDAGRPYNPGACHRGIINMPSSGRNNSRNEGSLSDEEPR